MNNQENNSKGKAPKPDRFQPKVLMIWGIIIFAIIALWMTNPTSNVAKNIMSIPEIILKAEQGVIVKGIIESDPSGGADWHVIRGTMKVDPSQQIIDPTNSLVNNSGTQSFQAEGKLTESNYDALRNAGLSEKRSSTMMKDILVGFLPFLLIIGLLYFLFTRQIKMAGKGAMSFGKSRAKMLTRDKDKVTFQDVAGCNEAKEEVSEIVDFLRDPKKFQDIGGRIPKGVLMVGPPGTGKTLLAKAVAGEADVPFFTISGSDFVEMFVGVGAARVRDMFEQGRKSAPCLIFIDEIDAVGRQRGAGLGGGNDEREQTLNSLLVEMDGFDGHEGVIIIAATNRPDVLDNALLRPGRFDRQVVIDLPDLEGRADILKVHAKKISLSESVDLTLVARNAPGFSGADLANLLNEGALIAARYGKKEVSMNEIDEAREKISFGRERRRLMDDEDRKLTAYHEAGHAIIQAVVDDGVLPVHKVTIIPRGQSLGSTMFVPKKDMLSYTKKRLTNQICCAMGGRAAEELVLGDISNGAAGDIKMATKIARNMVCDWGMSDLGLIAYGENQDHVFLGKEIARNQNYSEETAKSIDREIYLLIDTQYKRAIEILTLKMDSMHTLADGLLEYETLEGKHVHEILDHGQIQSEVHPTKREDKMEKPIAEEPPSNDTVKSVEKKDIDLGPDAAGLPAS